MKKISIFILLICTLLMGSVVMAENNETEAEVVDFKITLNDNYMDIKNPILAFEDRTYLPLRELSELLDLYVAWDNDSKTVEISDIGITVPSENSNIHTDKGIVTAYNVDFKVKVNGYVKELKNPVLVFNDRTYLPLREIAEILDCDVDWIDSERTVTIGHEIKLESNDEILYKFENNGLYGFTDENGKVVIEPQYTYAEDFSEGLAAVANDEYKFGYIDKSGNLVIPYQYGYAKAFSEGMAEVSTHDYHFEKNYFADDPNRLNWVFYEMERDSKCSYIDREGNMVIDTVFWRSGKFCDGFAIVMITDEIDSDWYMPDDVRCAYINTAGEIVYASDDLVEVSDFNGGFAVIKKDNGYREKPFLINTDMETVLDISQYDDVKLSNGFLTVKKDDRYGVIDTSGNVIIDFKYDKLSEYSEGLFAFKLNNRCGYIDINGNEVIENSYEMTDIFINGEAMVVFADKPQSMFFINKNGEVISKEMPNCTYSRKDNGMTMIYPELKGFYVNYIGEYITPQE